MHYLTVPKYGYIYFFIYSDLPFSMADKSERILKDFGKNLKKLREAKGLSTRQFAYDADISHSSVGRLEAGLSNPTLTTLIKIASALDADLDQLLPENKKG